MKQFLSMALCLLLLVAMAVPVTASASTATEDIFEPDVTVWYSVDYVREDPSDPFADAYVYFWTPEYDGVLTLENDEDCLDSYVAVENTEDLSDSGAAIGFSKTDDIDLGPMDYSVKAGVEYKISILTWSEQSGTVSFFASFAAQSSSGLLGSGSVDNPYVVDDQVTELPAQEKDEIVYYSYAVSDKTKNYNLTVEGNSLADSFNLRIENNGAEAQAMSGAATINNITPYVASGYIVFSIENTYLGDGGPYTFSFEEAAVNTDAKGTFDNPDTLVLDETTTANITGLVYYYQYNVTENGTLSVQMKSAENWMCAILGGAAEAVLCSSEDTPVVSTLNYPVAEGDEILVWVATAEYAAGTVEFIATFTAEGEEETSETTEEVTTTEATEAMSTEATDPTETTGTNPTESTDSTEATDPTEATTASTEATDPTEATTASTEATDPTEATAASTEATVPSETTASDPTATDAEGAFTELYDGYALSATPVSVGKNSIVASNVYPVTLFEFTPDDFGEYTIKLSDANALVGGYVGSVHFIMDSAVGTSNETVITFTSGSDIIIGVKGATNCTMTIAKTAETTTEEELEWNVYENTFNVDTFEAEIDPSVLTNVFIYDDVAETAVLGADGFYHLNSADGPVIYVDLNDSAMSPIAVIDRTKFSAVYYDENGEVSEKIDYTAAITEYINAAMQISNGDKTMYLYPLTADLVEMYQKVGETNNWYGEDGWVGGMADDSWMFACYYDVNGGSVNMGGNIDGSGDGTTSNGAFDTGSVQQALFAVAGIVLTLTAVAFVIRRKVTE